MAPIHFKMRQIVKVCKLNRPPIMSGRQKTRMWKLYSADMYFSYLLEIYKWINGVISKVMNLKNHKFDGKSNKITKWQTKYCSDKVYMYYYISIQNDRLTAPVYCIWDCYSDNPPSGIHTQEWFALQDSLSLSCLKNKKFNCF